MRPFTSQPSTSEAPCTSSVPDGQQDGDAALLRALASTSQNPRPDFSSNLASGRDDAGQSFDAGFISSSSPFVVMMNKTSQPLSIQLHHPVHMPGQPVPANQLPAHSGGAQIAAQGAVDLHQNPLAALMHQQAEAMRAMAPSFHLGTPPGQHGINLGDVLALPSPMGFPGLALHPGPNLAQLQQQLYFQQQSALLRQQALCANLLSPVTTPSSSTGLGAAFSPLASGQQMERNFDAVGSNAGIAAFARLQEGTDAMAQKASEEDSRGGGRGGGGSETGVEAQADAMNDDEGSGTEEKGGRGGAGGGASKRCEHNRQKNKCKECRGAGICEHGRLRRMCRQCKGAGICEHNRQWSICTQCKGSQICEHLSRRSRCKLCGGAQICEHGRRRSRCKDCGGPEICEHQRERRLCKECRGSGICVHLRQRRFCRECKAAGPAAAAAGAEASRAGAGGTAPGGEGSRAPQVPARSGARAMEGGTEETEGARVVVKSEVAQG